MQLADYLRYSRGLAVFYTSFIPINQSHYRQSVASYTLLLSRVGCLLCLFYLVPSQFPYWAVKPLFSGSTKPVYLQSINHFCITLVPPVSNNCVLRVRSLRCPRLVCLGCALSAGPSSPLVCLSAHCLPFGFCK